VAALKPNLLRCEIVAFARWDPFRDLIAIQHRIDRLSGTATQGWAPAVDLCETADEFVIKAELPGVTRGHLRISLHEGRLTLQGRREARVTCEHYHQIERGHGEFCRSFALPPSVDADRITAEFADGVLTIVVPKVSDASPRRVTVS
jgi:HSP20 family protein